MTNQTRKYIWPVSLAMSLALVGVLVAFVAMAGPQTAQAHGPCNFEDGLEAFVDCAAKGGDDEHTHDDGTPQPLDTPNPQVDAASVTSLDISWDAVAGADNGYRVEYMGPSDAAFHVHGTVNATSTRIPSLEPGTLYTIRITALGVTDVSEDSEPAILPARTAQVSYDLTVDGAAAVELNSRGVHVVEAEITTTSPVDQTTVAVRITNSDGTMYYGADPGISFTESGLRAVGPQSIDDGNLVIDVRDAATRVFTLNVTCRAPSDQRLRGTLDIEIRDDRQDLVAEASIACVPPGEPPPPTGEAAGPDCYAVTGSVDEMRDDLDLYMDTPSRTVNSAVGVRGIFRNSDGTLDIRNRRAEIGQDTTEVLYSNVDVQITVTSCEAGPVYIRFVDSDGDVFGTDVDEDPAEAGADVVGLDSQGKLELNINDVVMTAAQALMYDQYNLVETALNATDWVQYLEGKAGTYQQGKFLFKDACSAVGDHFYVEVYEKFEKDIQQLENGMYREKITCVPSLQPDANELRVSFDTADIAADGTGTAVVTWEAIDDAAKYTVAVIDTSNVAMYTIHGIPELVTVAAGDPEADRIARFPGIVSEKRYIFAVYAEITGGGYSALRSVILTPEFVAN